MLWTRITKSLKCFWMTLKWNCRDGWHCKIRKHVLKTYFLIFGYAKGLCKIKNYWKVSSTSTVYLWVWLFQLFSKTSRKRSLERNLATTRKRSPRTRSITRQRLVILQKLYRKAWSKGFSHDTTRSKRFELFSPPFILV